jgi:hypothetical protein
MVLPIAGRFFAGARHRTAASVRPSRRCGATVLRRAADLLLTLLDSTRAISATGAAPSGFEVGAFINSLSVGSTNIVPVPAGLPLLLTGIALVASLCSLCRYDAKHGNREYLGETCTRDFLADRMVQPSETVCSGFDTPGFNAVSLRLPGCVKG